MTSAKAPLLLSVVITLYNKERYIERTIRSVLEQSYREFEVIVIDDGSTDGGGDIVEAIADSRIRLIRQANAGQSAATNAGIRAATGDTVAFLDADDTWLPQHLGDIAVLRRAYPDAGLLVTGHRRLIDGRLVSDHYLSPRLLGDAHGMVRNCFQQGIYGGVFWTGAIAIPLAKFAKTGYFLEHEKRAQDIEMWARYALAHPVAFHSEISAIYHWDAAGRGMALGLAWYPPFARYADNVAAPTKRGARFRSHVRDYKHRQLLSYVGNCARHGDRREIRRVLAEDMSLRGVYAWQIMLCRIVACLFPLPWILFMFRVVGSRWLNFGRRERCGVVRKTYYSRENSRFFDFHSI